MRLSRIALLVVPTFLAASACGDPEAPTFDEVVGTYEATLFTTRIGVATVDQLEAGASITLVLAPDGSTTGRLFVPEGNEDGSDFDASLAGTWLLNDRTVTLDHATDTFMRDMSYRADGTRLTGEETFGDVRISVVLSK
jgi:hypothetical protein